MQPALPLHGDEAARRTFRRKRARRARVWAALLVAVVLAVAGVVLVRLAAGRPSGLPDHPVGLSGSWKYVWGDEFGGDSLDTTLWQPDRGGHGTGGDPPFTAGGEAAWFSPQNVAVRDGDLVLSIRRGQKEFHGVEYPLSSGVVQSTPDHTIRPGTYVEARIEVPVCDGCWPAFWQVPPDRWPPEIDTMEYFDTATQRLPRFNYHEPDRSQTGPSSYGAEGGDYRQGFHVYGLYWDGRKAVPYLDGHAYPAVAATRSMTDLPLILIFNLSVKRGHHPAPGAAMRVDWVRVWRK